MRSLLACCTLGALALGAACVAASPVHVRTLPPGIASAPKREGGFCTTDPGALAGAMSEANARPLLEPLPTPHSRDIGDIAVLEDDGTMFYQNSGGDTLLDLAATARAFRRAHGDDYDCVAVWLASGLDQWLGSPTALAASWVLHNDTQGIGLDLFDYSPAFGGGSRLQWMLTMNGLHRYADNPDSSVNPSDSFTPMDVLAHEFAHRWLAYVFVDSAGTPSPALLGRAYQHWGFFFDADSSYMEGNDWTQVAPDSFRTTGVSATFGMLDKYLMGAITRSEIDSFFTVNDPTAFDPPGIYVPISPPTLDVGCRARATQWRVDDIERVHGPRVPDGSVAPREFRVAFVLVVPRGGEATAADLAKLETYRHRFEEVMPASTLERITVNTALVSGPAPLLFAHAALGGTEHPELPRPVGVSVRIEGGAPRSVDPASVTLWWHAGTTGNYTPVPMLPAAPDSFAAPLPPTPAGPVQYWFSAANDMGDASGQWPPGGAAAPFAYQAGQDLSPPVIQASPMPRQSRDALPHALIARVTDDVGVDSVWLETTRNGGPLFRYGATRAGADSFRVEIGSGAQPGDLLAWHLVARDRAAAANLAVSPPGWDTVRVGASTFENFENGAEWIHQNVLYSWRDRWQAVGDSTAPDGPAVWKCGEPGAEPYPPHLDAALYTGWYTIAPGSVLAFDHRWALEEDTPTRAWDGARLEAQLDVGTAPFAIVTPIPGYTHTMRGSGMPFAQNSACWSGRSPGWVRTTVDLAPYAGHVVRFRFRMCADDFLGDDGWRLDRFRLLAPGDEVLAVPPDMAPAPRFGSLSPNPARRALAIEYALAVGADLEWTLHDILGRRVALLAHTRPPAGAGRIEAAVPRSLPPGLYFARMRADGVNVDTRRVVIIP